VTQFKKRDFRVITRNELSLSYQSLKGN